MPMIDEVVAPVGADLQPVWRAAGAVGGVDPLGHHAFELHRLDRAIKIDAALDHVIGEAQRPRRRQDRGELTLAIDQRQGAQVVVAERQEVEREVGRGISDSGALDVELADELRALLQALEARSRAVVEHHHLAVEQERRVGKRRHRPRQVGKQVSDVGAAAVEEPHAPALLGRHQAEAVVLELEQPVAMRERPVGGEWRASAAGPLDRRRAAALSTPAVDPRSRRRARHRRRAPRR